LLYWNLAHVGRSIEHRRKQGEFFWRTNRGSNK
jgi:hypothetical protein